MARYGCIAVQPEWSAEYEVSRDGDVTLTQVECDGESMAYTPPCIDRMLCEAARADAAADLAGAADDEADLKRRQRIEEGGR